MNCDELQQLAALEALGVLPPEASARLRERCAQDPEARAEWTRFLDAAGLLAVELPLRRPSPTLRERVLARIRSTPQKPADATPVGEATEVPTSSAATPAAGAAAEGIRFVMADAPWMPAPLPGSRMKVLSAGPDQPYAMLLVEIGAGVVYPEHDHLGAEEMFILSGDLQSEGRTLGPGDLLHAEPGTHHRPLRSVGGCTAIMVVSREALAEAMGA